MATKTRYIILVEAMTTEESKRFYEYMKYGTADFVIVDCTSSYVDAYIVDSYYDVQGLMNAFSVFCNRSRYFIAELTGEIVWRNPHCGFSKLNQHMNRSLY